MSGPSVRRAARAAPEDVRRPREVGVAPAVERAPVGLRLFGTHERGAIVVKTTQRTASCGLARPGDVAKGRGEPGSYRFCVAGGYDAPRRLTQDKIVRPSTLVYPGHP
jgi:hypothetical protein